MKPFRPLANWRDNDTKMSYMAVLLDDQRVKFLVLKKVLKAGIVVLSLFVLEIGGDLLAREEKACVWCKVTWTRFLGHGGENAFVDPDLQLNMERWKADKLGWCGHRVRNYHVLTICIESRMALGLNLL
jgi:hypothetical protein